MEKKRQPIGSHRVYRERSYAFGQQLLTLRTRGALTQGELADQIGIHRRSLQKWEGGESYPKAETLQRLIAVLLAQGVFTPGQEAEEATQLWQQYRPAAADTPSRVGDARAFRFWPQSTARLLGPSRPRRLALVPGAPRTDLAAAPPRG